MIILCVKLWQGNKGPASHWVIVCWRLVLPHARLHFANVKPAAPLLSESAWFSLTRAKYLHHYDFQHNFSLVMRFWKRAKDLKATTKRSVKKMRWIRKKNEWEKKGARVLYGPLELTVSDRNSFSVHTPPPVYCPFGLETRGVCTGDRCKKAEPQKTLNSILTSFQSEVLLYSPNLTPSSGVYCAGAVLK